MLTITTAGHRLTVDETAYIRLAATIAAADPPAAAAMLRVSVAATSLSAAQVWQRFRHDIDGIDDVGEDFRALWFDGDTRPYLVFLMRHAHALAFHASGEVMVHMPCGHLEPVSRASEDYLLGVIADLRRPVTALIGSLCHSTPAVVATVAGTQATVMDSEDLQDEYGTANAVLVLD